MMRKITCLGLIASWVASGAWAYSPPTETGESGLLTIPTTDTLPPGRISIGAYARRDIESNLDFEASVGGLRDTDLTLGEFVFGIGLFEGFELSTQIPYVAFQIDQPGENTEPRDLGAIRITPKFQLFEEGDMMPLGVALLASVALPTGDEDFPVPLDRSSLFQDEVSWEVMGIVDKILFTLPGNAPVVATGNIGALFLEDEVDIDPDQQTQPVFAELRREGFPDAELESAVIQWGAGLKIPLWKDFIGEFDLLAEYRGNTGTIDDIDDYQMVLAGARYMVWNGLAIGAGVDFGLTDILDRYNIVAGVSYTGPQDYRLPTPEPEEKVVYRDRVIEVERLIFGDINFDFDKATLTHQGKGRVYLAAQKLKTGKNVKVEIQGHTDYIGTEDYNKSLGLRRAETIKAELQRLGVSVEQISTVSFGESQPLIDKETPWARAVNRRVEFVVVSEPEARTSTAPMR